MKQSPRRTFALAVALGLVVLPVSAALAYFLASGTGSVSGATVTSTSPATVSLSQQYADPASEFVYEGPSTTALSPGGTVRFGLNATCLTSCPASVGSVRLVSVTSDKAGCNSTSLPGTFTSAGLVVNMTVGATTYIGQMTVSMNSDPDRDQSACLGATLVFNLATP
jgi:hypothetical protein